MSAVERGYLEGVKALADWRVAIDGVDGRLRSALHISAEEGQVACLKMLCGLGANVEALDKDLRTPMHLAALAGRAESVVALRREAGARIEEKDIHTMTPLALAAYHGHFMCCRSLLVGPPYSPRQRLVQLQNPSHTFGA